MADDDRDDPFAASNNAAAAAANGTTSNTTRVNQNPSAGGQPRQNPGLDRRTNNNAPQTSGVVQPKPQALTKRAALSSIIVSPRQKGNPLLSNVKSLPWEYGDIVPDYILGQTTCALFLSLKYHRLHPEYIYTRIKALKGQFNLRVVLCMVDITNHEASLKELSKMSLINNVTLILCWSAAEGGRYLELFKSMENAAPTSIKQHQSNAYADRMVAFVTTPRSVNKTDAVALVSQFGSVRTAINAPEESVAGIAGWGQQKVKRWCGAVREPFRVKRAARRGLGREASSVGTGLASRPVSRGGVLSRDVTRGEDGSPGPGPANGTTPRSRPGTATANAVDDLGTSDADRRPSTRIAEDGLSLPIDNDEDSLFVHDDEAVGAPILPAQTSEVPVHKKRKIQNEAEDPLSDGIMAALSRLRNKEGG